MTKNNKNSIIHLIISVILILSIGLTTGYTIGYYKGVKKNFPEIKIIEEINKGITTIKLLESKNGIIYGEVSGDKARIAYNPESIIEAEKGSSFEIPINQINLKNFYSAKNIPENTHFIASGKGKYYYSIFDKKAFNIIPENRIYFKTAEEAEKKGYKASK